MLRCVLPMCDHLQNVLLLRVHQPNEQIPGVGLMCAMSRSCCLSLCCEWKCYRGRMLSV